jgi:starch synthase (maltosyl-transferring)
MVADRAAHARGGDAEQLRSFAGLLAAPGADLHQRRALAGSDDLVALMRRHDPRAHATSVEPALPVWVEPLHARFSTWYEMFPRSAAPQPGRHGTLRDVAASLPRIAAMGFDVLYLPPIHPIGRVNRKGCNNSVESTPEDVGSPWAIGSAEGGHKAVHPQLGTLADFDALVAAAARHGVRIALDVAFQAAPDHPYVREHPGWFRKRPDGSIQCAENPPKRYEDIYPFDFECDDWRALWDELASVFEFWIARGVTVFRVDNPHTKSFTFWEWCIDTVKQRHPEVVLLSEAFTRPKVMYRLAKLGFTQSYTYFPWRNGKDDLVAYLTELTKTDVREVFRANHWPNTPDILTEHLQHGGRPAFVVRAVLAATLGASYGIYGPAFERCEVRAIREGSEEYLDSEKYQLRDWSGDGDAALVELISRLNAIRRDHPALQQDWTLRFHAADGEQVLCYSKSAGDDVVLVVVDLDPHHDHRGFVHLDLEALGLDAQRSFQAHDLLTGARYLWQGPDNYVELSPRGIAAHVFAVRRRVRTENDFEYFL